MCDMRNTIGFKNQTMRRLSWTTLLMAALSLSGCVVTNTKPPGAASGDTVTTYSRGGAIASEVLSTKDWMSDLKQCPRDVMTVEAGAGIDHCTDGDWSVCLDRCRAGSARDCYWLAQGVQPHLDERVSEALFMRSCRLGVASGCTNRAAGMLKNDAEDEAVQTCAFRTFEKACERDDPWGCTMQAFHLIHGVGTEPDTAKARQVLEKSCRNGPEDEACIRAMELQEVLDKIKRM